MGIGSWLVFYIWLVEWLYSKFCFLILPNVKNLVEPIIYNYMFLLAIEAKGGIQEEDRADNNYNKFNKDNKN